MGDDPASLAGAVAKLDPESSVGAEANPWLWTTGPAVTQSAADRASASGLGAGKAGGVARLVGSTGHDALVLDPAAPSAQPRLVSFPRQGLDDGRALRLGDSLASMAEPGMAGSRDEATLTAAQLASLGTRGDDLSGQGRTQRLLGARRGGGRWRGQASDLREDTSLGAARALDAVRPRGPGFRGHVALGEAPIPLGADGAASADYLIGLAGGQDGALSAARGRALARVLATPEPTPDPAPPSLLRAPDLGKRRGRSPHGQPLHEEASAHSSAWDEVELDLHRYE
ncbi:hypothetical protein FNF29_07316 [Cafeteria roenbergensis]|uniref:Uncharacterized protein n=1 Tax=Cafeteria roenbergensis TaxID=33653 RepID=A0A5A8C5Y5_CAFRO|nr:hypothetical protein FNF29_07316 [Cafeteria roenbergensis]|eukprot:KAA0147470.1 hypothetical protein FNF29_07316 [Cafeteria roenbergensis]